jgi:hypothetical protein
MGLVSGEAQRQGAALGVILGAADYTAPVFAMSPEGQRAELRGSG